MKKNNLKNYLTTGFLGFIVPFLLWNCESENVNSLKEQQNTVETVSINEAIGFFIIETTSKTTKTTKKDYVIPYLTYISQEAIINSPALLTVIPATTKHKNHYSRILLLKINNKIQSLVFSMHASVTDSPYFSGEIMITDLQGEFLNGYRVENGRFVSQFRKKEAYENTAAKTGNGVCPEHGECNGESDCILCLQELDEVEVTGEAGGSGIEVYPGLNDFPDMEQGGENGPDTGMSWDYGPGEGMASEDDDENVEDQIVIDTTFANNPCLMAIYEQMGGAATFKNYLKNFDGDFSVAHLKFSSSTSLPSNTNAETSAPQNYIITITFNENKLNRPSLSVARTFIHEMIHAEMFRKLLSVAQHPSIQLDQNQLIQLKNDYPGLYDYYMRWKWNVPQGQSPSSAQHEAMAQHYRNIIKQALQEFDNAQISEVYEALSWIGLQNTVAWYNLSQNERDNINQIINNFSINNPNCQ